MGSCGRRGAGCPCDSEKSWSNIQLRRKYKEGNYDRGHFDGSLVQQQPHQGSGGAHQDQRVRRQLPALRPHRLQLREQGQPDRVQPGGVQGNQLPRWLTCPNIAWKLLPRHKPLPSKKNCAAIGCLVELCPNGQMPPVPPGRCCPSALLCPREDCPSTCPQAICPDGRTAPTPAGKCCPD